MAPLEELTAAYEAARADEGFQNELDQLLRDYAGRPTPLFFANRLTEHCGGGGMYLKRESLLGTGGEKINKPLGKNLLAPCMPKRPIVSQTARGQDRGGTAAGLRRFC